MSDSYIKDKECSAGRLGGSKLVKLSGKTARGAIQY